MSNNLPKAIILDMDGILFHGEQVLSGAVDFLTHISDIPHLFLTNNPILPAEQVVEKFARIGLPAITGDVVLTSGEATALYLHNSHPGFSYFAVGANGLHQVLSKYGVEDLLHPDFVVVGEGAGLDYQQLTIGINLIVKQGARLIGTNPDHSVDAFIDQQHRILPGGGALLAPFAIAAGVEPTVIGKPQPLLYEMAMAQLHCDAEHCLMIGDRPDTDIAGAVALGMHTALVRSGRFQPGEQWPDGIPAPDWDVNDLDSLGAQLVGVLQVSPG